MVESDSAATIVEVFADITCPFTHVGLKRVVELTAATSQALEVIVRAWPLEWVNGSVMDVSAVQVKAKALCRQLDVVDFDGLRADAWPTSTIPALNLAAAGYGRDAATGLAVSLALRSALFEQGRDIGDSSVLAEIAADHGLESPSTEADPVVRGDYEDGKARGVTGSPHFWIDDQHDFFCPALDLGHDDGGNLTARFDAYGLEQFLARIGQ